MQSGYGPISAVEMGRASTLSAVEVSGRHDDDRTRGVAHDLIADRAEEEAGEATVPAGADNEQLGVVPGLELPLHPSLPSDQWPYRRWQRALIVV